MVLLLHWLSPPTAIGQLFKLIFSSYPAWLVPKPHSTLAESRRSLKEFDVHPETGFFPPRPLPRLPPTYARWEEALISGAGRLSLAQDTSEDGLAKREVSRQWRQAIDSWPVLSTDEIKGNLRYLQRAHYVLAWLVHLYVHSIPLPTNPLDYIVVPKSLAVPLVEVSKYLECAPVLTFADTVLWNWEFIDPEKPLSSDNIRFVNLFSGTEDEANFYLASARAELQGIPMLRIFHEYQRLGEVRDATIIKVQRDLMQIAAIINEITEVIQTIRPTCDPHVFYWQIRPWFSGSGSDGPKWKYQGVENDGHLLLSGPSAGQSSVMHALDIFLDVDHKGTKNRGAKKPIRDGHSEFMDKMRDYMPGKHRAFLHYLSRSPRPIRDLAQAEHMLREPFNTTIAALGKLRSEHIKVACRYIVTMAHSQSASGCPIASMWAQLQKNGGPQGGGGALGTGGNEVATLLKRGRDATTSTAITGRS